MTQEYYINFYILNWIFLKGKVVMKMIFVWSMEILRLRGELSTVIRVNGLLFVI